MNTPPTPKPVLVTHTDDESSSTALITVVALCACAALAIPFAFMIVAFRRLYLALLLKRGIPVTEKRNQVLGALCKPKPSCHGHSDPDTFVRVPLDISCEICGLATSIASARHVPLFFCGVCNRGASFNFLIGGSRARVRVGG